LIAWIWKGRSFSSAISLVGSFPWFEKKSKEVEKEISDEHTRIRSRGGLELAWRYLPLSTALPRPIRAVRVSRLRSFRCGGFPLYVTVLVEYDRSARCQRESVCVCAVDRLG
jgi:hypothetical protein